ncbi:molybdate ABC transporter substrate-binding protein [Sulfurovum mangrovi]|uniref:molybdate ABC transporter substrate-binding protein n=1 Tax=Sulfurovum mangrovi TaxID=2893889 RepID=UPI001E51CB63|nr:molybdate ABC transporter substrate-binding protein [Sulfurovum mangrovi]UFH58966.1 molybdate ABC transporter substrate-binding protein [Sulfurovum mangrovi]
MKKILLSLFFGMMSLSAGEIKIAVAANVSYAIDDLKKEFNALYPETKVQVTLGSSGKLTAQIKNGAPYQLFMAANMKYPEALYKDGIAVTRPLVYAQGSLAYLSSKPQDFTKGIALIKDATINKIAIANPKTAPYGKAAVEAMKNGGVLADVEKKFVFAESISQTVSYAVTAADIGFIAKSSLYSPKMAHYKEGVNWSDVDTKLYTPINQGIVVLKNGEKSNEVAAFYTFMLSAKAKEILQAYGYLVP